MQKDLNFPLIHMGRGGTRTIHLLGGRWPIEWMCLEHANWLGGEVNLG